jgi:hypothetical protein
MFGCRIPKWKGEGDGRRMSRQVAREDQPIVLPQGMELSF